jgi:hypothetical protein
MLFFKNGRRREAGTHEFAGRILWAKKGAAIQWEFERFGISVKVMWMRRERRTVV